MWKNLGHNTLLILQKSIPDVIPIGQMYARVILVEYYHDIFPEYLEKVVYEIPGNIPK